jgi:hypothetical protein
LHTVGERLTLSVQWLLIADRQPLRPQTHCGWFSSEIRTDIERSFAFRSKVG